VLGKYFGSKDSRIRPFVGVGASYAIFFDARATETLNRYQGGANDGDTSVSVKNAFGVGPFLGVKAQLDDDWHLSFSIGKLRYKTEATLVTRNTTFTNESEILRDYPPELYNAILGAQDTVSSNTDPRFGTTLLLCDLALAKTGNTSCNQGTFVRKQSTKLDNTLFTFGIGRRF
jgi:outer membrane protein W